jgi:hypothetical protein
VECHDENVSKPVNIVRNLMPKRRRSVASDTMIKHEPEVRRAKAKGYVAQCNREVHEAPWVTGRTNSPHGGGVYVALELAERAYQAHALPYEQGLSKMGSYDPRRFTWVYDEGGEADDCVKVRDDHTGRLAIWPHWAG